MTAVRIGRFGATVDLAPLTNLASAAHAGDKLSLTGRLDATDQALLEYHRATLAGHQEPDDEQVLNVQIGDHYWDGWCRLDSGSVDVGPGDKVAGRGHWPFKADLTLVARELVWNSYMTGANLGASQAVSSPEPFIGFPGHATEFSFQTLAMGATEEARATSDGSVWYREANAYRGIGRYVVDLAHHYEGAATIEQEYVLADNSKVWLPVAGRRLTPMLRTRITNGLVRATVLAATDATHPGCVALEWWGPTDAWTTPIFLRVRHNPAGWVTNLGTDVAIRNDPAEVRLQLRPRSVQTVPGASPILHLGVRRGGRHVYGHWAIDNVPALEVGIVGGSAEAAVVSMGVDVGAISDTPDAAGMRWILTGAIPTDVTATGIEPTAALVQSLGFGAAAIFADDTAASYTVARLIRQYLAGQGERLEPAVNG